jgi:outer membrane protein assembly factor BamB
MHNPVSSPLSTTIGIASALSALFIACSGGNGTPGPTVTPPAISGADVLTWHNDLARTGQNLSESMLTPSTVNSTNFGLRALWPVDGRVDAQPLYVGGTTMADGVRHNVLVAATEHDTVYAFDADKGSSLWKTTLLGAGETTSDDRGCGQVTPEIGVTSTPVIDRSRGAAGFVYVVAMSKNGAGQYFQRLHALELRDGTEIRGSPVTVKASYPGNGAASVSGLVSFDPAQYKERAALLLLNGALITTWASHCDISPYTGWIISYDAGTLAQLSVLNITPNGSGGSNWASGAGPAVDAAGAIYYLAANGTFDTLLTSAGRPAQGDYGNAFLRIGAASGLSVADYFATFDAVAQSNADGDLGSGGAIVLPDMMDASGQRRHLALGAGKDAQIYVVDRDAMGGFDPAQNHNYQTVSGVLAGSVYSSPAYFNGTLYYGAVGDSIRAFPFASARLPSSAASRTGTIFGYPGATPSVSANAGSAGIVWAVENAGTAVLHAYDASDLSKELYNSNQAATRDQFGAGNKFITPTVTAGKVFVGTTDGVAVFGLLH